MLLKFGLFSLKSNVGCTSLSIHIANYLAGSKYSVALIESKTAVDKKFDQINATKNEDKTMYINNVHIIPAEADVVPEEDILIYDFGEINILHEFDTDFHKLYLCTDSSVDNIVDINSYLADSKINCEVILIGASKEELSTYKEYGHKCILIPDQKERIINYDLSLQVNKVLRLNGMMPPEYHKDWVYDPIVFGEEEKQNKSFFESLFGLKPNKKKEIIEDIPLEETEAQSVCETFVEDIADAEPVVAVVNKQTVKKSSPYKTPTFIDVPIPNPRNDVNDVMDIEAINDTEEPEDINNTPVAKKIKENTEKKIKAKQEKEEKERAVQKHKEELELQREREKREKEIERLRYQATHDSLTKVKNRAGFDEDISNMKAYALIAFDVNDLKYANDTFGHQKGDELLLTVSNELTKLFENVYRVGGDEFSVLMHGKTIADEEEIQALLRKFDATLLKKTEKSKDIRYQAAYGIAFSTEGKREVVLSLADERMYEDKKQKKIENNQNNLPIKQEISQSSEINPVIASEIEEEKKNKKKLLSGFRSKKNERAIHNGHIAIFVTELRHSAGASYIAGSIASALTDIYNQDVFIDRESSNVPLPDNIMVRAIETDEDKFMAYKNGLVVLDKGVYADLSESAKNEMLRADMNIMVCTADEDGLKRLATFINENESMAHDWIFAFNHVQENQKKTISAAMDGFDYMIIPFHDNAEVPVALRKDYKDALDFCTTRFT